MLTRSLRPFAIYMPILCAKISLHIHICGHTAVRLSGKISEKESSRLTATGGQYHNIASSAGWQPPKRAKGERGGWRIPWPIDLAIDLEDSVAATQERAVSDQAPYRHPAASRSSLRQVQSPSHTPYRPALSDNWRARQSPGSVPRRTWSVRPGRRYSSAIRA